MAAAAPGQQHGLRFGIEHWRVLLRELEACELRAIGNIVAIGIAEEDEAVLSPLWMKRNAVGVVQGRMVRFEVISRSL